MNVVGSNYYSFDYHSTIKSFCLVLSNLMPIYWNWVTCIRSSFKEIGTQTCNHALHGNPNRLILHFLMDKEFSQTHELPLQIHNCLATNETWGHAFDNEISLLWSTWLKPSNAFDLSTRARTWFTRSIFSDNDDSLRSGSLG